MLDEHPVLTEKAALEAKIQDLQARNERLALTNRMLRDKIKELIDHLADFGVYVSP